MDVMGQHRKENNLGFRSASHRTWVAFDCVLIGRLFVEINVALRAAAVALCCNGT